MGNLTPLFCALASHLLAFQAVAASVATADANGAAFPASASRDSKPISAAGGSVTSLPDTWSNIRGFLAWDQVDMEPYEIVENALNYSFLWSAMVWNAHIFRAANPEMGVGLYTPAFIDLFDARPLSCSPCPGDDTPERRARTLLWWQTEADGVGHPDWVLYKCDGVTPAYQPDSSGDGSYPHMPLDITNPAVIDWQVRNTQQAQDLTGGFTAFSGDLFWLRNFAHACGIYRNGEWVQLFTGRDSDSAFTSAAINWARQIRERLRALPSPMGLVVNTPIIPFLLDQELADLTANLDGIADEEGFTNYGHGRTSGDYWLRKIRVMIAIQNQGVAFLSSNAVSGFPPSDEELDWILSSFLMGKEHSAYILINSREKEAWWPHLAQYDENVGHPCGPMEPLEDVYLRNYSHGLAIVNPSLESTYAVRIPAGSFHDLRGDQMKDQVLVLGPTTGTVLLTDEERCP